MLPEAMRWLRIKFSDLVIFAPPMPGPFKEPGDGLGWVVLVFYQAFSSVLLSLVQYLRDASASFWLLHTLNASRSVFSLSLQKQRLVSPLSFSMLTNFELVVVIVVGQLLLM